MSLVERLDNKDQEKRATEMLSLELAYKADQIVEQAFRHFRERGFPYKNVPVHVGMQQLNTLAIMPTEDLPDQKIGNSIADSFHHHRFHSSANGMRSPFDSYSDDRLLRTAIEKQLKHLGQVPSGLFSTLQLVNGTQACANFRPGFALWVYRKHCPPGGVILDTSTGYGGRLVGFLASQASRYIGIDPNTLTHAGNLKLAEAYGASDRVQLINLPAEDVNPDEHGIRGVADCHFCSPPYFSKELYSDEETQSCVRYKTGEEWKMSFLYPLLKLQYDCLKPGGVSVLNIASVQIKGVMYPLFEWAKEAADGAGFDYEGTDWVLLSSNRWGKHTHHKDAGKEEETNEATNHHDGYRDSTGNAAREPVLVFRKPLDPSKRKVIPIIEQGEPKVIRLYRISEGDPETDLYVYTTHTEESLIRSFHQVNDHSGRDFESYQRVATKGKIAEIKALDQIPQKDHNLIPYETDEWVESLGDYLLLDKTIKDFLG